MGTYGHLLIQIFSAKTAVCPPRQILKKDKNESFEICLKG
jgi:hypothetical protein